MKRRAFLTGSVSGTIGAVALGAEAVVETKALMATPAVVMAPRTDGVEVVWAVNRLCRGWVEWREAGGEAKKCAADDFGFVPQGDSVMRVRLDGLQPGKSYELRAIVEAADGEKAREETPWKSFRTLDPSATEAHFVVWNDTHENHETIRRLHEVTPAADFLLWNGDTCNDWHQEAWLVPTLLSPAGQDVSAGRPLFLVWGNHDVRGKWAFKVKDMMAMPQGRPFYAFRNGPVACICLHTGEDKPDNHPSFGGRVAFEALRSEQAEWLKQATAIPEIRDAPHKVVFCHIPLRWIREHGEPDFAGGGYNHFARECRMAWHDELVKWGAQVVISGHTHQDAWIPADGKFPYAQMVSGGPKPAAARWIEGKAGAAGLKLTMRDLTGKTVHEVTLPRLA
jgi:predicted phosphodiesterase